MTLLLSLLTPALGQTVAAGAVPDLNAQYFRPSLDSTRTFWVDESTVSEASFAPKLLLHYTDKPLVYAYDTGESVPLVRGVAQADLMLSANLDRFRLGVDVPV